MALKQSILWGINGHNRYYPAYAKNCDEMIPLAAELGCTIFRIDFTPNTMADVEYIRGIIRQCHDHGMQVLLVSCHLHHSVENVIKTATLVAENLKDEVEYFQIFNETDCWACRDENGHYNLEDPTGMSRSYFNPARVEHCVVRMKAAVETYRKCAPDAKLMINISVRHYPMLDFYREAGIEWDVIGIDNYEEWDYYEFFHFLEDRYPGYDLMIAECNYPALWGPYDDSDQRECDWLEMFLNKMNAYDSDRLKAVIVYELLDQPEYEIKKGSYHGESHFGLVALNPDNTISHKRPAFDLVKKLYRGE